MESKIMSDKDSKHYTSHSISFPHHIKESLQILWTNCPLVRHKEPGLQPSKGQEIQLNLC